MLKIGEFSKLVQVSVPTLRYYDQVGLLKPVEVDRSTGYRYYSASQLPRLHRILALKGLGFSLEQIVAVLAEGLTPEQMRGMLRLRHAQISQQLAEMQSQLVEVEVRLQQIEREDAMSSYDVILKHVDPQLVASVRATLPEHNAISPLYAEVYTALGPHASEAGLTLAIWYDEEYREHDVDGAAAFLLRSRVPERGGSEEEALARLRAAVPKGPVLIGPLNMGYLAYNPNHSYLLGADHYIIVLNMVEDHVLVHDPKGFPSAALPVDNLLKAWRTEGMDLVYTDEPYIMRTAFRPGEPRSHQQMIERTLPFIRANLQQERWQPGMFGGVTALRMLARTFHTQIPEKLAVHVLYFALPLGLRHKVDAQVFLREGNQSEAAELIEEQARLLGRAQYAGVQRSWSDVAALIEQVATLEERLLTVCQSW